MISSLNCIGREGGESLSQERKRRMDRGKEKIGEEKMEESESEREHTRVLSHSWRVRVDC
jgi:hypothetical protein